MMKPAPSAAMMNKAEAHQPKSGHMAPAPAAGVGGETKANMKGALLGSSSGGLSDAVSCLKAQHSAMPHIVRKH